MYLAKVFKTSEMPDDIWLIFEESGSFVPDGFGHYTIGDFVKEAELDPKSYTGIEEMKALDNWFINVPHPYPAKDGETVLVEHG